MIRVDEDTSLFTKDSLLGNLYMLLMLSGKSFLKFLFPPFNSRLKGNRGLNLL